MKTPSIHATKTQDTKTRPIRASLPRNRPRFCPQNGQDTVRPEGHRGRMRVACHRTHPPQRTESGAGVRPNHHHRRGGHGDGGGYRLPAEPLQSLHTVLHQPPEPEPEAGGRAAAGRVPVAFRQRRTAAGRLGALHCSALLDALGFGKIMHAPRSRDRFTAPSFIQRDRFSRFQPTYPYVQHEIDLPPTISLSDGEEPPPYQGPCTLQLRDPEQQMELNRESVRAPPNRTIFDSDLIDIAMYSGGPCPPSSNSGISASTCSSNGRMEGPPPTYSEVMGHHPGASFLHHQRSNAHRGSRLQFQQNNAESTIVPIKGKDRKPGNLV
ncbi:low-density lipoprotein receptor class A domain-containing protein 4 isoform X2 [Pongo pygmaeus]|uniref:low-density lipoprotein receptor class A domain-containing protein 4 isoform X2 n=1 Tax=Pongo pygmaeus TaxID=9600 RepID=UPI00300D8649